MINSLKYWILERECIRIKKAKGAPYPWTTDEHLAKWRFCNVNRCDDRETRWIFKHIVEKNATSPVLWFNLAIARFINWSPTLYEMGYYHKWDQRRFCTVMENILKTGGKAYTGAYMIRGGTGADALVPKHEYLVNRVFNPLWDLRDKTPDFYSCQQWSDFFKQVFGMGDFMRNQIITDMKYTHHLPKQHTVDWTTFILAGPGTVRGLNRLHARPLEASIKHPEVELEAVRTELAKDPALRWARPVFQDLNNLANCFCEWDKFRRLIQGEGTPRSYYTPSNKDLP